MQMTMALVMQGKTFYPHSFPLHPGVLMATGKLNAGGNPAMDWHPIQGGVEILQVVSCYRNCNKIWSDELVHVCRLNFTYSTIT